MSIPLRGALAWRPLTLLLTVAGAALTIYALVRLQGVAQAKLLIPSFGSTCALVFGVPHSPYSRPLSVVGGHIVASIVGLGVMALLGHGALAMGLGVGCAIVAMLVTRTMHPPAGGDPLILMALGAGPAFLLAPILAGTVAISLAGLAYRALIDQRAPN